MIRHKSPKSVFVVVALLVIGIFIYLYQNYGYLIQSSRNFPKFSPISNTEPVSLPSTSTSGELSDPKLSYLQIPPGFAIHYFSAEVPGARSLATNSRGVVYVGTRPEGVVYALEDSNNDGRADIRYIVASGLNNPNGVVYHNGDLYVAEIDRIIKFTDIDNAYKTKPKYSVVYDNLPTAEHHGWRYMSIGPDNKLYIAIGVPCNICQVEDPYATIARLNLDGTGFEIIARGIRNSVGFDWNPVDNSLWFTENGRDSLGDDKPEDELNRVGDANNFGFPFCHQGNILDPQFGKGKNCGDYESPKLLLGPHVAALGIKFYKGDMYPADYQHKVIIAEHGSWNRTVPIGYRVMTADITGESAGNYQALITGFLDAQGNALGRPVDILELSDGSILISDDKAGAIYRLTYQPQ